MSGIGAGTLETRIRLPLLGTRSEARAASVPPAGAPHRVDRAAAAPRDDRLVDSHGRTITDLRLSITDRCNFRCLYCLDPGARFAPRSQLLTIEELAVLAEVCIELGVERIRITGGEPTMHHDLGGVIRALAALPVRDLSMTTNGALATRDAIRSWRDAGLRRLTFSLDAVGSEAFASITRSPVPVDRVIDAIATAIESGLTPVKVNAVVMRGRNEQEVAPLAALARRLGFEMRFIEFMPLDSGRRWDPSMLVPADEILDLARGAGVLRPLGRAAASSTSEGFEFAGPAAPGARIGVIAPVTRSFCGACSRLRITADGRVRPCLFSLEETDLMSAWRSAAHGVNSPEARAAVRKRLLDAVWSKQAGHGIRQRGFRQPDRTMSAIGG